MTSFLKKSLLAAILGLGALSASVPAASAAGLDVTVETVGYRSGFLEVRDSDRWDRGRDRWDRRHDRRDRHGDWGRRGRCSPDLAIAKARDAGLRRARIVDMSPRRVVVEGFRRGDYRRIVFANDRHCPALWR
jgi:hypothetical protein